MDTQHYHTSEQVLSSYSVTVYAATLIFISGHGSTISFAQEGRAGNIRVNMGCNLKGPRAPFQNCKKKSLVKQHPKGFSRRGSCKSVSIKTCIALQQAYTLQAHSVAMCMCVCGGGGGGRCT